MLAKLSIGGRIALILGLSGVAVAVVFAAMVLSAGWITELSLDALDSAMLAGQKDKLKVANHAMAVSLGQALKGVQDEEARLALIRAALDPIRYEADSSGYFFVFRNTVCLAHPKKELQGKDMGDFKDSNSVYYIRELERAAKSGGGFVAYVFAKPGRGEQPKLSHAEMIPGTDLFIGTGVYIDNIDMAKLSLATILKDRSGTLTMNVALGLGAACLMVILPLSLMLARGLILPLKTATRAAEAIAAGNLDIRLESAGGGEMDRLQEALNTMVESLSRNIQGLEAERQRAEALALEARASAEEAKDARAKAEAARREGLCEAARRIEGAIEAISRDSGRIQELASQTRDFSSRQNERVGQTARAMREMNATVLDVAKSSAEAAQNTAESKTKADEGRRAMDSSLAAVGELLDKTAALKAAMDGLVKRGEAIGLVMDVISDIADQTNLLALNAAIEAARAGDAGRGFAVVADEVRKLAEKTMTATKEVGQTIMAIKDESDRNRRAMDEAGTSIQSVSDMARTSGRQLTEIAQLIDEASSQVQNIAAATEEQAAASEEIKGSVDEVAELASRAGQSMDLTVSTVESLAAQIKLLFGVLAELRDENNQCQ